MMQKSWNVYSSVKVNVLSVLFHKISESVSEASLCVNLSLEVPSKLFLCLAFRRNTADCLALWHCEMNLLCSL
jgi:hypothetical protein